MDNWGSFFNIVWFIFLLLLLVPLLQKRLLLSRRLSLIKVVEKIRSSRVVTMIHRQEVMNFLGFPIARFIDIEDSERIMRAIKINTRRHTNRPGTSHSRRPGAGLKADRLYLSIPALN